MISHPQKAHSCVTSGYPPPPAPPIFRHRTVRFRAIQNVTPQAPRSQKVKVIQSMYTSRTHDTTKGQTLRYAQ